MSISIKDLEIGKSAKITEVGGEGALRQHFLEKLVYILYKSNTQ